MPSFTESDILRTIVLFAKKSRAEKPATVPCAVDAGTSGPERQENEVKSSQGSLVMTLLL